MPEEALGLAQSLLGHTMPLMSETPVRSIADAAARDAECPLAEAQTPDQRLEVDLSGHWLGRMMRRPVAQTPAVTESDASWRFSSRMASVERR